MALEIVTQVTAGLAAVQKQKLVHRDIKPSNIMVSFDDGGAGDADDQRRYRRRAQNRSSEPAEDTLSRFG